MRKTILLLSVILVLLVSCSSLPSKETYESVEMPSSLASDSQQEYQTGNAEQQKMCETFDSYGYNVEGEDLSALAEVLYASGEYYGAFRTFDVLEFNLASLSSLYKENIKQWMKVQIGLDSLNYAQTKELLSFLTENRLNNYSFKVGDFGPAGGIVIYDKGDYIDGWRYLEAAPADLKEYYTWGDTGRFGTSTEIGTGKKNTETIASKSKNRKNNAAKACLDYAVNGYDDWFLPSKEELNLMYMVLHAKGIGSFAKNTYWSSSEDKDSAASAWRQYFGNGDQDNQGRNFNSKVRAIRVF